MCSSALKCSLNCLFSGWTTETDSKPSTSLQFDLWCILGQHSRTERYIRTFSRFKREAGDNSMNLNCNLQRWLLKFWLSCSVMFHQPTLTVMNVSSINTLRTIMIRKSMRFKRNFIMPNNVTFDCDKNVILLTTNFTCLRS